MTNTSRILATLSVCAAAAMIAATLSTQSSQAAPKATIQTDLSDYPPGTQVNVTGSGWLASEVVELTFTETATTPPGGFTDGPFIFFATSDGLGNIANGGFSTDQHDVGVHFLLTAKGAISGRTAQTMFTDNLPGLFQIDGNATGGTATSHDWDQVFADKSSPLSHVAGTGAIQFTVDGVNSVQDDTFANSPKDTQDITAWKWGRKAVSASKTDLAHGFAAAYQESGYAAMYGSTHTLLFVGTDRFASGSNSAISIWFLQHPIGQKADGTFENKTDHTPETHSVGDLLIQASLGSTASVVVYKWIGGASPLSPVTLSGAQEIHAINTGTVSVPWAFLDSSGSTSPMAQELFEVGLDLNEVFHATGANLPDFSSFIITTRTSTSQTATLSDFILGNVSSVPDIAVAKAADAVTVSAGGQVGYTVTVSNVGAGDVTGATLNDPLPAGAGNDLNWSFATGGNPGGVFQITGSVGSQVLSFASSQSLPFNSTALVAHVVATSSSSDLGKLPNTATVATPDEGADFLSNNSASADIVVVPVAVNDTYSTALNGTLVVPANGVRSNDGTPISDFTSVLVSGPTHGTLTVTLNANGSFTYKPTTGYIGPDSFTYKDLDAFGNYSNVATVNISMGNAAPVANNDSASGNEDSTISGNVLTNDTDADGNSLTVTGLSPISGPSHGTLTLNADGSFTYTPNANYSGSDSFTYQATDSVSTSNTATVTITVNPINDPPVANADSTTVNEDTTDNAVNVLANDTDLDNVAPTAANTGLTVVAVGSASHGTVSFTAGGVTYTPTANYYGPDSFTYTASDNGTTNAGHTSQATVSVTVTNVNDAPVAVNGTLTTPEDTAAGGTLVATDIDSTTLTYSVVSQANAHGTVTITNVNTGAYSYTPAANYNGPASFTFKANDGSLDSNVATISITVTAVNDAPVGIAVNNDTLDENDTYDLSGSFSDADSTDTHTVTINWGDGSTDTVIGLGVGVTAFAAPHQYLDDNASDSYAVTVSVVDNSGAGNNTGNGGATVTVHNAAPIVVMSASPITLSPGDAFSRPGSFFDAGTLDTWSATVDYGDGLGPLPLTLTAEKTFSLASPAYATAGVYTVTVSVTDDDSGAGIQSFYVNVGVPAVAIAHVEDQTVSKGSLLSMSLPFTGTPVHGYASSINWGDSGGTGNLEAGSPATNGSGDGTVAGSHTYSHKGTYTVFVTVTDSSTGVSHTIAFGVTVN
jgi:VCBS repeat-containing protein